MYLDKDRDQWWALSEHGNEPSVSIKGGHFLPPERLLASQDGPFSM